MENAMAERNLTAAVDSLERAASGGDRVAANEQQILGALSDICKSAENSRTNILRILSLARRSVDELDVLQDVLRSAASAEKNLKRGMMRLEAAVMHLEDEVG